MGGCSEAMSQLPIIPLKPIPIKDRVSMIFVYYGRIDMKDGVFVVVNKVDGGIASASTSPRVRWCSPRTWG